MPSLTLEPHPLGESNTEASTAAAHNFAANAAALRVAQQTLLESLSDVSTELSWIYGRDGYLTGVGAGRRWWTGCSVPLLTARAMLKTLEAGSGVSCFLNPIHAAQVRVALERHGKHHALICLTPDLVALKALLHCDDLSADIERGRLWFAWGESWSSELSRLLEEQAGLPTPSRFIRLPNADGALVEQLVVEAQRILSEIGVRRAASIAEMRNSWKSQPSCPPRICIVARSAFRLWDDAGNALWTTLSSNEDFIHRRFDADAPAGSSPSALAMAASDADAVVTADFFRADAGALTAPAQPWITWVTTPRIAPFQPTAINDRLLLADPNWNQIALAANWPADRIETASWPAFVSQEPACSPPAFALIADTIPLEMPDTLADYSSHALLWEQVCEQILRDPFTLPSDVATWLSEQARAHGIAADQLDISLFITRLIIPAYQQALADTLLGSGIPVRLYGHGWEDIQRFSSGAAGAITSRADLEAAAREATALVHAWPCNGVHPIDSLGRSVLRCTARDKHGYLRDARLALAATPTSSHSTPLSTSMLHRALGR